jgi:hypothetical protein
MIHGILEIEQLSGMNEVNRWIPNFGQFIELLYARIEAIADASLSKEEFLNKTLNQL